MDKKDNKDNYESACKRHFDDGLLLYEHSRHDNAVYHFAFAVECGFKYFISRTTNTIPQKHNLQKLKAKCMMEPKVAVTLDSMKIPDKLCKGHPERRYWQDSFSEPDSSASREYARFILEQIKKSFIDSPTKRGGVADGTP